MKKPEAAIERLKEKLRVYGLAGNLQDVSDLTAILSYLGSLKPWPRELTRECLLAEAKLVAERGLHAVASDLIALAELAPEREKRMVNVWRYEGADERYGTLQVMPSSAEPNAAWVKKGGPFEVED